MYEHIQYYYKTNSSIELVISVFPNYIEKLMKNPQNCSRLFFPKPLQNNAKNQPIDQNERIIAGISQTVSKRT